jgi:4-hydroxybenzoate polyprenyltransferase
VLGFYNVHGVLSLKKNQLNDIGLRRYYKSKSCRWITMMSVCTAVLMTLTATPDLWIHLFLFTFGSLFYDLPIWRHKKKTVIPSVREWPNVKAFLVATVISLIIFLIPSIWSNGFYHHFEFTLWGALWFHLLLNTLMGDLRDLRLDARKQLRTLPVWLGFKRTRWLLIVLSFLMSALMWFYSMSLELVFLFLGNGILLLCFIREASKPRRYHVVDIAHWIPLFTHLSIRFLAPLFKAS